MATDKKLNEVDSQITDFDYALIVKGSDVKKISKDLLATVLGGLKIKGIDLSTENDLDNILEMGVYNVKETSQIYKNHLLVVIGKSNLALQFLLDYAGATFKYRVYWFGTVKIWHTLSIK